MYDSFSSLHPIIQALLAGLFTWFVTAVGAASVFFGRGVNRRFLDGMLGFSGGVMLAASYWSLLGPAIEISAQGTLPAWLPPALGFLSGGAVLWMLDKSLPHLHLGFPVEEAEGPKTSWRRAMLLVTAITQCQYDLGRVRDPFQVAHHQEGDYTSSNIASAVACAVECGVASGPKYRRVL